jgi:hypothetical protein
MVVDSAKGDYFDAYYAPKEGTPPSSEVDQPNSLLNPLFDASASWFTWVYLRTSGRDAALTVPLSVLPLRPANPTPTPIPS